MDQNLLRVLLENSPDAIYFKDLQSRFIKVSRAHATRFGLTTDQMVGKTDFDIFPPEHAGQAFGDEQQIIATGNPVIGVEEYRTYPDGRAGWVNTTKQPLYDEDGTVVGTFGISRDITTRKLAQEALLRSEEQLRRQNEAMQQDLARAQVIQRALLPAAAPTHERLSTAFRYEPLESVGGDYFGFAPEPRALGFMLGDLTGHGVSAALFMALIKFLTDRLMHELPGVPSAVLHRLNTELMDQMPSTFITAICGHFDFQQPRVRVRLAGAGHPDPVLYRAASGEIEKVPMRGNGALGLIQEFSTEAVELELDPGDRLFVFTDGLTETTNAGNELLSGHGLRRIIAESHRDNLDETVEAIMRAVAVFREGLPPSDDALLLAFGVK